MHNAVLPLSPPDRALLLVSSSRRTPFLLHVLPVSPEHLFYVFLSAHGRADSVAPENPQGWLYIHCSVAVDQLEDSPVLPLAVVNLSVMVH